MEKLMPSEKFDLHKFLCEPIPKSWGMVQFRVVGDHADDELFILLDYSREANVSDLLMTAVRDRSEERFIQLPGSKMKHFIMRTDDRILGRVEQTLRTKVLQYNIFTAEASHEKGTDSVFSAPSRHARKGEGSRGQYDAVRRQLGAVEISNSRDKPREMNVLLPEVVETGDDKVLRPRIWKPLHAKEELLNCWHAGDFEKISFYENKKPQYDEELEAYTLDFAGRVTLASSKNFLLVSSHDVEDLILRFGRVEDGQFVMDVAWPMSPLLALGISLASVITRTSG